MYSPTNAPGNTDVKTYRKNWTVGGLLVSLAVVPVFLAVLAVPQLVAAATLGALSAKAVQKVTKDTSGPTADRSPSRSPRTNPGRL